MREGTERSKKEREKREKREREERREREREREKLRFELLWRGQVASAGESKILPRQVSVVRLCRATPLLHLAVCVGQDSECSDSESQ